MYPIEMIDWWTTLIVVFTLLSLTFWVWWKDGQPAPVGLMALPISFMTAWTWFGSLPLATAWAIVIVTFLLFVVGMMRPEGKDNAWHYAAMAVALFGKMIARLIPWVWHLMNGKAEVTIHVWQVFMVIMALAIIGLLVFSKKIKGWTSTRFRRNTPAPNGAS